MELQAAHRYIKLIGALNVRDLGGYRTASGRMTVPRRFIRSDSLHNLKPEDMETLKQLNLSCVLDLRREREVEHERNPYNGDESVEYHNISVFPSLDPREYSRRPDILQDLYIDSLHQNQEKYAEVIRRFASARGGAVLFHCTMGKDRTGLVSAILLDLVGVDRTEVLADYALTEQYIAPLTESILTSAGQRGIDPESYRRVLRCDTALMNTALRSVETRFGSIENWLRDGGVSDSELREVKARLLD